MIAEKIVISVLYVSEHCTGQGHLCKMGTFIIIGFKVLHIATDKALFSSEKC